MSNLSLILFIISAFIINATASANKTHCDGERMTLLEANNENIACAVLIDDELIFPRNIVARKNQIWLIDKGSNLFVNGKKKGALYRYEKLLGGYLRTQILNNLDDPNDISIRRHSDGQDWVYFTTRDKVQRIPASLDESSPIKPETVIDNLSTYGWHKLVAIHITQNALYLTVPSASDHCEIQGIPRLVEYPCGEEQRGTALIREYTFSNDTLSETFSITARGLRDPLAVQTSLDGKSIIAADNGWDQVDFSDTEYEYSSTPHDEINIIDLTQEKHFGWPYCFDNDAITPPYTRFIKSCEQYQAPTILLDAHSAPLNMMYFHHELLVNLHGNNQAGGKTVSFKIDENGLPLPTPEVKLNWHYNGHAKNALIGRPFGLSETSTNELLLTDDWNHQLIKVVFKSPK